MLWRTPNGSTNSYAVDTEGRLILCEYDVDPTQMVIRRLGAGLVMVVERSGEQLPELNQWGNSSITAALGQDGMSVTIDYGGQHYVVTGDEENPIIPELSIYQP